MKKIIALLLALVMVFALVACAASNETASEETAAPAEETAESAETGADETAAPVEGNTDIKIGVVLVGDENEGYTLAHILGIRSALENLGLNEEANVVWKYVVPENEECKTAIEDCIDQGCTLVFTNSYGHQDYAKLCAEQYPDIQIVSMTGDTAKASGLSNFHNAFTKIYQARYVAGVVAGMKIAELVENGELTDANYENGKVLVGYVGAFPYAEVISGFSAFFLGIKSIYPEVAMKVLYTSSWFDITAEKAAAEQLIGMGCCIIGQHADSTGAPSACEAAWNAGTVVYSVGYNIDMLTAAPNAALVSPTNEWGVYYTYAIGQMMKGEEFDTNWAEGFETDSVAVTTLGPNCAEGTQEKVDETIAALKDGFVHVFAQENLLVGGTALESAFATDTDGDWTPDADEAIFDGYYHESYFQSAPAFAIMLDDITALN